MIEEPTACYNNFCIWCWLVEMLHNDPRYTEVVDRELDAMIL